MKEQVRTRAQILSEIKDLINELDSLKSVPSDFEDSSVLIGILTERFELSSVVFNSISEAMYLIKVEDNDFSVALANEALQRITGLDRKAIVGKKLEELVKEPFKSFTLSKYKEAIQKDSSLRYENSVDFGSGILVLDVNITPIRLNASKTKYIFGEFRDITEKKKAEKELKLANERLESLWSISSLHDLDNKEICDKVLGTVVEMTESPHGFFGFINEDETKMTIFSWLGDVMKDCKMVEKPLDYMIAEAGIWGDVVRKRRPLIINDFLSYNSIIKGYPQGHIELKRLLVCPIFVNEKIVSIAAVANKENEYVEDDIKQVTAYLNNVQLIIDKKKSEIKLKQFSEELIKTNKTKEKLLSIISHDLRSPIQGILGISEALSDEIESLTKEEIIEYSKEINIAVKKQYRLLKDLLDWSKIHRTDFTIVNQIIDLHTEVEKTFKSFYSSASKKNIALKNCVAKGVLIVFDNNLLQLVLRNLISNGIKYTNSGGWVQVMASETKNSALISVEDNGVGIEKELFNEVLTNIRFSRNGTASEKGSGLGLPLCKEILEKCGGKIWVESEIGRGSKFTFELMTAVSYLI